VFVNTMGKVGTMGIRLSLPSGQDIFRPRNPSPQIAAPTISLGQPGGALNRSSIELHAARVFPVADETFSPAFFHFGS
jgi:hypothetical protein